MELLFTVIACFCFMLVGALIGHLGSRHLSKDIIKPLLDELHYSFKHVSARDLQVYHGVNESDWLSTRPHDGGRVWDKDEMPTDLAAEAERLAQEFERLNGDLPPTAE
jgi:hypothetical protein